MLRHSFNDKKNEINRTFLFRLFSALFLVFLFLVLFDFLHSFRRFGTFSLPLYLKMLSEFLALVIFSPFLVRSVKEFINKYISGYRIPSFFVFVLIVQLSLIPQKADIFPLSHVGMWSNAKIGGPGKKVTRLAYTEDGEVIFSLTREATIFRQGKGIDPFSARLILRKHKSEFQDEKEVLATYLKSKGVPAKTKSITIDLSDGFLF